MSEFIKKWDPETLKNEFRIQIAENMDRAAGFAAQQAKAAAPVDRGILRSDIAYHVVHGRHDVIEGIVGVRKRAFWAWFVELGTVNMAARPFLRPSVFGNAAEIMRLLAGD
jgi:HK97 gp10 family phage protein